LLWNGSITFKDNAIQLVLIVDYILDWARDVYRPSILRHLKSIATGKGYDDISLADDSDVFSMRRHISSWIPAPPTIADIVDSVEFDVNVDQSSLLPIPIPNTKLGSIRSATIVEFRFAGLRITESNVTSLLRLTGDSQKSARELVSFISRWDEMLSLTSTELDELEYIWTGNIKSDDNAANSSMTEEFYILLEFRCFLSNSWQIIKEITSLAISKSAFEILITYAKFQKRHRQAESLPDITRTCQMSVLRECVECLKSGSPWQVLLCAITSLLMSFYPMPERKRTDFSPPVDCLGFGYRKFSIVKPAIEKFLELGQGKPRKRRRLALNKNEAVPPRALSGRIKQAHSDQSIVDLSFRRVFERRVRIGEGVHDPGRCDRCRQGGQNDFYTKCLIMPKPAVASTYGAILVESPDSQDSKTVTRHDLCLFLVEDAPLIEQKEALPLIVEDILQADLLYHTITHPLSARPPPFIDPYSLRAIIWNLPLPYRQPTEEQRIDIMNWCHELLDQPIAKTDGRKNMPDIWTRLQMLLYFLRLGNSHIASVVAVKQCCDKLLDGLRERNERDKESGKMWPMLGAEDPDRHFNLEDFFRLIDKEKGINLYLTASEPLFPPSKLELKGNLEGS
jgi:hypothetical protein